VVKSHPEGADAARARGRPSFFHRGKWNVPNQHRGKVAALAGSRRALLPLIRAYSHSGDIVLDPFAGSGSTGLAFQSCGWRFILIEQDDR
jgi:DNA modification methylase